MESGGIINNPIEQLKYTACFALTKFYLSGAQLKPFNPIIGETFQANIGNSHFYLEQTSHHPPISNFYGFGRNYKIYGWNESSAETGPNSVEILYKGNMIVEYQNGTKNTVIYPSMKLGGTMIGQRILKFKGKVVIIDKENDLICIAKIDPDERKGIEKISKKKLSFPDYVKGVITSLSKNITVRRKQYHVINKQKFIFSILEGEFTNKISFDGNTYWEKRDNGKEGFAEMYSAKVNNPESWECIKKFFPESVKIFEETMAKIFPNLMESSNYLMNLSSSASSKQGKYMTRHIIVKC